MMDVSKPFEELTKEKSYRFFSAIPADTRENAVCAKGNVFNEQVINRRQWSSHPLLQSVCEFCSQENLKQNVTLWEPCGSESRILFYKPKNMTLSVCVEYIVLDAENITFRSYGDVMVLLGTHSHGHDCISDKKTNGEGYACKT
jgi:hypothetical protein